jgi:enoyl-CoA hydratase/carnithine racemase
MKRFSTETGSELSLLWRKHGRVAIAHLNRPKVLNSLSIDVCKEMNGHLIEWKRATTHDVTAFILKSTSEKAFCAGGDVKAIWTAAEARRGSADLGTGNPGSLETDFFREEYTMNYLLGTSPIPQVSLWNGIVMGGGVGISIFGNFRVATEKALFAMPETTIGLVPDVGGSFWLPHIQPAGAGLYVGLSGCRLGKIDVHP